MKNKLNTFLLSLILMTLFIMTIIYSQEIYNSVIFSISIWKDKLLPSLLPFLMLSNLLIEYNSINILNILFKKPIEKIFHLSKEASSIIFISLFSGFPSSSIYIKDYLEKNIITKEEANHLITFTHFSNPSFVITTIGILLLNNKKLGYYILICHIISNIIIGIFFRNKKISKKEIKINEEYSNKKFIKILTNSIKNSFITLVNILGIITFFLMIITILKNIIHTDNIFFKLITSTIELTNGIKIITDLTIPLKLKCSLIGSLLSFGGISIHFQVKSIIEGTSISYKKFLIARIIHSILCFILVYFFIS